MKKAKKLFLFMFLMFAVLFSVVGIVSQKADMVLAAETATVQILGNEISDGYYTISSNNFTAVEEGDDWQIHFDADSSELVLRNLNLETDREVNFIGLFSNNSFRIVLENSNFGSNLNSICCSDGETTIELIGTNKITRGKRGIYVVNGGTLKLEGDGSLEISCDEGIMLASANTAITVSADISIYSKNRAVILANGIRIRGDGRLELCSENSSEAVYVGGDLNIRDANLEIININPNSDLAYVLYSERTVSITDSKLNIYCSGSTPKTFFGLYSKGNLTVKNGEVFVENGFEGSQGVYCGGTATVDGGFIDYLSYAEKFDVVSGNIIYGGTNYSVGELARINSQDYVLVPENKTLIIPEENTVAIDNALKLSSGASIINNGKIINNGTFILGSGAYIENNGEIVDNGVITVEGVKHIHSLTKKCYYNDVKGEHCLENVCADCPIGYIERSTEPHEYKYTSEDNVITEYCSACGYINTCTFEIENNYVYDGKTKTIVVSGAFEGNVTIDVEYYRNMDGSYEKISEADVVKTGDYFVKAVVREKDTYYQSNFTISPKTLTVTGAYADSKDYDGNTSVYLNEIYLSGAVSGDDVILSAEKANVSSADAGYYNKVVLSGITVSGEDGANYIINSSVEAPVCDSWGDEADLRIYPLSIYINAEDQTVVLNDTLDQTKWFIDDYYREALLEGHSIAYVMLVGDTSKSTSFGTVVPENAVIVDENGKDVTNNYSIFYNSAKLVVVCPDHDEFKNGFCVVCNGYEQPKVDTGDDPEWTYDDVYIVSNSGQLYWIAEYVNNVNNEINVRLACDIVVNNDLDENPRPWIPIMNFYGVFDGNFKTVSGLYVSSEKDQVGMFGGGGYSYGTIKNLNLSDSYFKGTNYVGGIGGYHAGTISNCSVDGNVVVIGNNYVGALTGYLAGTAENCYAYAPVLIGSYNSSYATVTNCYYLSETETEDGGKTAGQFANGEVAYLLQSGVVGEDIYDDDWNYIETIVHEIWGQEIGVDALPVLGGKKVYYVTDCEDNHIYSNINGVVHADLNEYGYCKSCQVKITGASISVGSSLTMSYQAIVYDNTIISEGQKIAMQFTMNGKTVIVYGVESVDGKTYIFDFEGIAPQNMTRIIDAVLVVVDENGTVVKSLASKTGYSVKENAQKLLELYPDDTYLVKLVTDMLVYGAAAQNYKNYNTDDLANAGITTAPSEKLPSADENIKSIVNADGVTIGDVYFVSATVWFDNVNKIGIKLSTAENAKLCVNGKEVLLESSIYYTDAILATEFDKIFTFELYEGETLVQTFRYSVSSYVYSMMNKTENGETSDMANLARALYRYGFSAKAYQHISNSTSCVLEKANSYEWANDYSICTAKGFCKYCQKEASKTVTATYSNEKIIAEFVGDGFERQEINLTDATNMTNEQLQISVSTLLNNGVTDIKLTANTDTDLAVVSSAINSTDKLVNLTVKGVTNIASHAFFGNDKIVSVSFPDVINVDNFSFMNCYSLKNVHIPKAEGIGQKAFQNTSLESIFSHRVTSIGSSAFYNCSSLESITLPLVTTISSYAFASCDSLKEVNIPNAVSINLNAFQGCAALESIEFPQVTSINSYAFSGCASLKNINIFNATIIGEYAFNDCIGLVEVSFPNATTIGECAFIACNALESISLPVATTIGKSAFMICSSLKKVDLPQAKNIDESAFMSCDSLTEVYLPEATSIGEYAFRKCSKIDLVTLTAEGTIFVDANAFDTGDGIDLILNPDKAVDVDFETNTWNGLTFKSIALEG